MLECARETTGRSEPTLRDMLARFLFQGASVHRDVATLSGGERMRLALAQIFLSDPVPTLLILDEPTNDLDVEHLEFLEQVLGSYRGAVVFVTHDDAFAAHLEPTQVLDLDEYR